MEEKPVIIPIALIGDDPIIQFVGDDTTQRDHGYSRRRVGKIWVKYGYQFVDDNFWGYFMHPITKDRKMTFDI